MSKNGWALPPFPRKYNGREGGTIGNGESFSKLKVRLFSEGDGISLPVLFSLPFLATPPPHPTCRGPGWGPAYWRRGWWVWQEEKKYPPNTCAGSPQHVIKACSPCQLEALLMVWEAESLVTVSRIICVIQQLFPSDAYHTGLGYKDVRVESPRFRHLCSLFSWEPLRLFLYKCIRLWLSSLWT